jgi:hypothetical protein
MPLSQSLLKKPKLFSKENLFQEMSEAWLQREIELIGRLKENILQGLNAPGWKRN